MKDSSDARGLSQRSRAIGAIAQDRHLRFRRHAKTAQSIVAARLQAECPPGNICITRAVRDQIRDQPNLSFEELGTLSLKNIARPVEAFVLRPTRVVVDSAHVQQPADDKPAFIFAGYTIDLYRRELRREDQLIHVEPQV